MNYNRGASTEMHILMVTVPSSLNRFFEHFWRNIMNRAYQEFWDSLEISQKLKFIELLEKTSFYDHPSKKIKDIVEKFKEQTYNEARSIIATFSHPVPMEDWLLQFKLGQLRQIASLLEESLEELVEKIAQMTLEELTEQAKTGDINLLYSI